MRTLLINLLDGKIYLIDVYELKLKEKQNKGSKSKRKLNYLSNAKQKDMFIASADS